jgi:peptidoglycan/LPS O-acetylase OafA/YrhL
MRTELTQRPAAIVTAIGIAGVLLDGYITFAALEHHGYRETGYVTSQLVGAVGLVAAVAVSVLARCAIFALLAWLASRLTGRRSLPIYALTLVAAAATWLVVLHDIAILAGGPAIPT